MEEKNHYFSEFPDIKVKIHTVSESIRRHLYIFKTTTGVFSFKKQDLGTKILIEHMTIPKVSSNLLDLGCGYGAIGLVLAYESPKSKVYLIDINKRAIWCAKENIKLNIQDYKKRVLAYSGNYFEPINKKEIKFDGIYMNPPIRKGKKHFFELVNEIQVYLKPQGHFQFVIRKKMGAYSVFEDLKSKFQEKEIKIIAKRSGYWVFDMF